MAKWVRSGVQDNGLNDIKNTATRWLLIRAYTLGDSYATVVSNIVAEATMVNGDYTLSGAAGATRTLTVASGKTAVASVSSGASPDLHFAFTDGTANVIWVTDETSNQVVTSGNTVNYPSGLTYISAQPT